MVPSRCEYPIADLAAALVFQHATVGLDHFAGGDVVLIAGEQSSGDSERSGDGESGGEHGGGVPALPGRGPDVVADVAADLPQVGSEPVADRYPAQVFIAIDPPQRGLRDTPFGTR